MAISRSFLLIKPDGIYLRERIEAALEARELRLLESRRLDLSHQQIMRLYLRNWESEPISATFMREYLEHKESHLIVVEGKQAISLTNKIKFWFRRTYAIHAFANIAHAPIDQNEFQEHILILTDDPKKPYPAPARSTPFRPISVDSRGWLNISRAQLASLVREVCAEYQPIYIGTPLAIEYSRQRIAAGEYPVILSKQGRASLDALVLAILDLWPGLSLKQAMTRALAIDSGHLPLKIAIGD